MVNCVWMRDGKGDLRKRINEGIPEAGNHHAMSGKTLSMESLRSQKLWGVDLGRGCIDCVSSLALVARETPGKINFDDVNSEFATVSQKLGLAFIKNNYRLCRRLDLPVHDTI